MVQSDYIKQLIKCSPKQGKTPTIDLKDITFHSKKWINSVVENKSYQHLA